MKDYLAEEIYRFDGGEEKFLEIPVWEREIYYEEAEYVIDSIINKIKESNLKGKRKMIKFLKEGGT